MKVQVDNEQTPDETLALIEQLFQDQADMITSRLNELEQILTKIPTADTEVVEQGLKKARDSLRALQDLCELTRLLLSTLKESCESSGGS